MNGFWRDFWFSVNTVAPLLGVMAVGYAARKGRLIDDVGVEQANSLVFHIFLPVLLCLNVMQTPVQLAVDSTVLVYVMLSVLGLFLLLFWLAPRLCPAPAARGVFIQGVGRSNYAIYGIPLVMMMYPETDSSLPALMVVAVVPLFNLLSTVALMVHSGAEVRVGRIVKGVLMNPLIFGTLLGFALWGLRWQPPAAILKPFTMLGSVATPLALFLLGASLDFEKARANFQLLWMGVAGRLVLAPLVLLGGAVLLGIRDVGLGTLLAVFASPTAVSSYPMAQQMGGDADLAAAQVVFTTALSSVTMFLWIFAFRLLGWVG